MTIMSGAQALLEILREEDIQIIFGNPGSTELPLMKALAGADRPRYVLGLHEAVVTAMADGYAQASGRPTMVNLHAAPGLANALGMLYNAQKAGAPLVVTAGQHDQNFAVTEPSLWGETVDMAKPFVKWAAEVRSLAQLPRILHRAVKTALAPPRGPVFLSLPADVLAQEGDIELGRSTRIAPLLRADPGAVERAIELLEGAEHPAVIAGDAVSQSFAHRELVELVELLGAPVYFECMAHTNVFPTQHPLFRAPLSRTASTVRAALARYDLIFSVGGDLLTLLATPDCEPMPSGVRVIHMDINPWEIGKNYPADVGLLCEPKATLPEISAGLRRRLTAEHARRATRRRSSMETTIAAERQAVEDAARAAAKTLPIKPLALMQAIGETLPENAVVIDETISSGAGLRRFFRGQDPQGFYGVRGGGIGWGLPAAVGVKLALPGRPVVALVGDGSAMYAIQTLWTAAHERTPVTFVILNNRSYRILKQRMLALEPVPPERAGPSDRATVNRFLGMDLVDPEIDFVGLARSLGMNAVRASMLSEVREALRTGLMEQAPSLIDVTLDARPDPN
jgi:benzoylformate decarboxylase